MSLEGSKKSFLDSIREELAIDKIVIGGHEAVMEYLSTPYENLRFMKTKEVSEVLHIVSRYCLHLRVRIGQAKAKLSAMESSYNNDLFAEAGNFQVNSLDERKALALRNSDKLKSTHREMKKQRMIIEQIDPVVWGLDKHCQRLETIIRNREENSGGI
jgi:hypothetical protein